MRTSSFSLATKFVAAFTAQAVFALSVMAAEGGIPQDKAQNRLLDLVMRKTVAKYERILDRVPADLINKANLEGKMNLNSEVKKKLEAIDKSEITVESLRTEANQAASEVLAQNKAELLEVIKATDNAELDEIASKIKGNIHYENVNAEYEVAYTHEEKVGVLYRGLVRDVDQMSSILTKRAGQYDAESFKKDLNRTQGFYNGKAPKWLNYLAIAGLVIAASGLVTWGISAGIYGAKLSNKRSDYENSLAAYRKELDAQFKDFQNVMNQQDLQFLKDNGYVYTTCATYTMQDSITCNGLNYALVQGTMYCSVNCYKNPMTGKETRHDPVKCTSPFIPSNCYDPNEYLQGKYDGYQDGYADYYWKGADKGYNDGADDGYYDGYMKGYNQGYDKGYDQGFYDGYASYFASNRTMSTGLFSLLSTSLAKIGMTATDDDTIIYNKGYGDGYKDGQALRLN